MKKVVLVRITTVPISLKTLLKGQLQFMSNNGFEVIAVSSQGNELRDVAEDENVQIISMEMTRTISPFKDIRSLWKFYRICKRLKPDIVHSHTPKAGIIGMLGAKLARVPLRLHTVAGLPLMEAVGIKRKLLDVVEKLTYLCSTKVYPNSKGLYDFIVQNRFTKEGKLKVLGNGSSNGINTDFFNPGKINKEEKAKLRNQFEIGSEDFVFIFVGRIVGDKGINELIFAFKQLQQNSNTSNNLKLMLVGSLESDLDPLFPETLEEIKHNKSIVSVGFQKDVRPYFSIANALVFPSYREGFPNVVMQAGAMQLPSVVSDINGCNEIIVDKENGIIVPVKDSMALMNAMHEIAENKEYYATLRQNSRERIISRYEQKVVWEAILNEYRSMSENKQEN